MRLATVFLAVVLILGLATGALAEKEKPFVQPQGGTRQLLDCTNAYQVFCGDIISGTNIGAPNNVEAYACVAWLESGGEVVYEFVVPGPECMIVTGTITDMTDDLDIFFLGSCDEADCIEFGDSYFTTDCLEPGTYYIVVDGYYASESDFTLTIDCQECECPQPDCCPFPYVCHFIDFNEWDGGFVALPCGGAPVWQWGTPTLTPPIACDDVPVTHVLGTIIGGNYPVSGGEIAMIGPFFLDENCTCLELCHYYDTEASFDGCNVKISTDAGATWTLATPNRGYDQSTNASPMCIPSEQVFSGHQYNTAFLRDCFDVSAYVGQEIWIGFFWGNDSSVQYPGWYIKWVKLGGEEFSSTEDSTWGGIKALYR